MAFRKLAAVSSLLVFVSCTGYIPGNYPPRDDKEENHGRGRTRKDAEATLYRSPDGAIVIRRKMDGWLIPETFIRKTVRRYHERSGGMPEEYIREYLQESGRYRLIYQLMSEEPRNYYPLMIDVVPGKEPPLHTGSFLVTLQRPGGRQVKIPDEGVLWITELPFREWRDSRHETFRLSPEKGSRRDGLVTYYFFLCFPARYRSWHVEKVELAIGGEQIDRHRP